MEIVKSTFKEIPGDAFGIVIMGCACETKEHEDGWINGVTNHLVEQGVLPEGTKAEDVWEHIYNTTTTGGRNDIVYVAKKDSDKFNVGRFAIVRLMMADCSWIEDWLVNYASHYGSEPRGIHAAAAMNRDDPIED